MNLPIPSTIMADPFRPGPDRPPDELHLRRAGGIMPETRNVPEWCCRVRWPVLSQAFPGHAMPLTDQHGMGDEQRRQQKAFLDLTPEDADRVRSLRAAFGSFGREFAERFYEHLLRHPHTAALLKDAEQIVRLKHLQAEYFAELLEGVYDAAYFEGRLRVGLAHQRVGLEPSWYLGAYNQYIQLTFPIFVRAFGENLEAALPVLLSLVKVIFLDIGLALQTYFHRATEELRRHNEELQQALRLYWQAHRREEQLHKLMSHEIRGGLAAMITSLEDLLETARPQLDPASVEQLEGATRRGWSLARVLTEMLASGRDTRGPSWVQTTPIFENLVARFGLYAEGRPIRLHLPKQAPRVWADPAQLCEVFANLVSNAVRHIDKVPGEVEILCRPEGAFYAFGVADNGPGVPEEIRGRIFEPFVRGPCAPGRPEGTGLGLYFVRTIVEQGGGRVWLESTPGVGSRFWFTVPREPPADMGNGQDVKAAAPPDTQPAGAE
jgi:signal transduction histidine kinase